ncbi:hypothetical protein YC2023_025316 [Brassica napus]
MRRRKAREEETRNLLDKLHKQIKRSLNEGEGEPDKLFFEHITQNSEPLSS